MLTDEFCREVEGHLCRRNAGHLVRIVGPSFDCVRSWAEDGIPLNIVRQGIDRCVDRQALRPGGRRRPVRVEFCDGDVRDCFDAWRRAIGVPLGVPGGSVETSAAAPEPRRHTGLRMHVDRTIARLTLVRARLAPDLAAVIDGVVRRLDALRPPEGGVRGAARAALETALMECDADLLRAAREAAAAEMPAIVHEAEAELEPYRGRLTADDFAAARDATIARLIRARFGLPDVAHE